MSTETLLRDGEIRRLLTEIRASLADGAIAIEPERLVFALRFEDLLRGCNSWRLARAQRELARLHVRELARLLRQASSLRAASERTERDSAALAAWRCALREELFCAARDGARATAKLHALLRSTRSDDLAAWPSASELARAALALHDDSAARLALGEAWIHEGREREAAAMFVEVLARGARPRIAARALEGLVRSWPAASGIGTIEALRTCA